MGVLSKEAAVVNDVKNKTGGETKVKQLGAIQAAVWLGLVSEYACRQAPIPRTVFDEIAKRNGSGRTASTFFVLARKGMILVDKKNRMVCIPVSVGLVVCTGRGKNSKQVWPLPTTGVVEEQVSSASVEVAHPVAVSSASEVAPAVKSRTKLTREYRQRLAEQFRAQQDVYGPDAVPVPLGPKVSERYVLFVEDARREGFAPLTIEWFKQFVARHAITYNSSALCYEFEQYGLLRVVSGSTRMQKDPAMRVAVRRPVILHGQTEPFIPPECSGVASEPALSTFIKKSIKTKEDLQNDLDRITEEIQNANRSVLRWLEEDGLLQTEIVQQEAHIAQLQLALTRMRLRAEEHQASRPPEPDTLDLEQKAERLRLLIDHYDLLLK